MAAPLTRAVIIALTAAALITWYVEQPVRIHAVETKYCPISQRTAIRDRYGNVHIVGAEVFGPCSLMGRYEEA